MADIDFKTVMVIEKRSLDADLSNLRAALQAEGRDKEALAVQAALRWMDSLQGFYDDVITDNIDIKTALNHSGDSDEQID